jgi:SWI/SNF-related matrix-associated actin-dependent regulator 1 of chromatin subfamily A
MAQVGYLLRLAARLKIDAVCKKMHGWLKENPDEKLVVMCIHRDIGESLVKNISVKSIQIHGGVTGKDRQLAVDVFQRDPETRLAVCNIKAAGIGVDGLQKAARRLSFVELWWNPSTHFQCEGRLERIGQEREILIDYIVGKGTIEERLCRILQSRQKVASAAIDGDKEVATFNIYEELLNEMKKESK